MNSIPSIAVVIPVFNKRSSILRTLQCIMAQTTPVTEIVVVDDCSTDGSVEVVESSQIDRLRIIKNASQLGPGAARDVGWRSCQSDYIAFLDADDEWDPRFIEVALDLASRFPRRALARPGTELCPGADSFSTWSTEWKRTNLHLSRITSSVHAHRNSCGLHVPYSRDMCCRRSMGGQQ